MLKRFAIGLLIVMAASGLAYVSYWYLTTNFGSSGPVALQQGRGSFMDAEAPVKGEERAPQLGHPAPPFTLFNAEGDAVSLSELQSEDKPILLNFWTSDCPPCIQEIPHLQDFYERYQDQVQVVGINWAEDPAKIRTFLQEKGVTYPNLIDRQGKAVVAYRLTGTPTSFLLDEQNIIRGVWLGPITTEKLTESFAQISTAFDPQGTRR